MKVLISDKLSEQGLQILKSAKGLTVDYQPDVGKDSAKLKKAVADAEALVIRSATKVTKEVLAEAKKLRVIGRAGIGVDNVDVDAATERGIIVMNTPLGNAITTAEHAISMMCALTREIPQATASIKSGKWEKSRFLGSELYQKTLGVIGCGNIGKIVADRALGLKMKVAVYDPFLTDELAEKIGVGKVELDTLLKEADYITIHVPKNDKTANMINREAFAKMKKGAYLINCARGGIVNETDLANAIKEGIVAGAALDVFEQEPVPPDHPLLKLEQVICTPHIGAATGEAQENVALDVAKQIVNFLVSGTIQNAVNFPSVSGEALKVLRPFLDLAEKMGKIHGQLASESPREILIDYFGEISKFATDPITVAVLKGILEPVLEDVSVNLVNAPVIARSRGIKVRESKTQDHENFASLISVTLTFKGEKRIIEGTIFGKSHPRLVRLDNAYLEAVPEGTMLFIRNEDKPGVVGNLGTLLGKNKINISRLQLGLNGPSKEATAIYNVEGDVTDKLLLEIGKLSGILSVQRVVL